MRLPSRCSSPARLFSSRATVARSPSSSNSARARSAWVRARSHRPCRWATRDAWKSASAIRRASAHASASSSARSMSSSAATQSRFRRWQRARQWKTSERRRSRGQVGAFHENERLVEEDDRLGDARLRVARRRRRGTRSPRDRRRVNPALTASAAACSSSVIAAVERSETDVRPRLALEQPQPRTSARRRLRRARERPEMPAARPS